MTEPVYTTATTFEYTATYEELRQVFVPFREENIAMLVNSMVYSAEHPVYVRHWTNAADAQAWYDTIIAFAAEHGFEVRGRVEPIEITT